MECHTLLTLWEEGLRTTQSDDICTCFSDCNGVTAFKTYQNIHKESCIVKERLILAGCAREVVGLFVFDGGSIVATLIGILSANAAFHCIPNDIPAGWLEYLITTLRMRFIIGSTENLKNLLSKLLGFTATYEEIEDSSFSCITFSNVTPHKMKHDIVYVITTSGTTGTPKIVWVPNSCIVPNILCFREVFEITSKDTVFQASPLTFDPSVVEIFMTLSEGGRLVMVQESLKRQPLKMGQTLMSMQVTVLQSTPTLLKSMGKKFLRQQLLHKTSPLRVLALGGENFPDMQVLRSWKDLDNKTAVFNVYGITEVSSWATWYHITERMLQKDVDVPLGVAIPDTELKIVDNIGNESDQGLLHIGGLARVCLIDDEQDLIPGTLRNTGDLVRRDSSGNIWYDGRSDDQVKRLGKRLNLVQIEQVLQKFHPDITAVAVYEEVRKALYVFLSTGYKQEEHSIVTLVQNIKHTLQHNLPAQYQPDDVIVVDVVPVTHHGIIRNNRAGVEYSFQPKGNRAYVQGYRWHPFLRDDGRYIVGCRM